MTKGKNTPPKWVDVYPSGTKSGDEESKFFRVLARNPRFEWRSTGAIAKESGLSKDRVEEIILKYFADGENKHGMVFQSPKNEDHFGYWERVPYMVPDEKESIAEIDKDDRIDNAMKSETKFSDLSVKNTDRYAEYKCKVWLSMWQSDEESDAEYFRKKLFTTLKLPEKFFEKKPESKRSVKCSAFWPFAQLPEDVQSTDPHELCSDGSTCNYIQIEKADKEHVDSKIAEVQSKIAEKAETAKVKTELEELFKKIPFVKLTKKMIDDRNRFYKDYSGAFHKLKIEDDNGTKYL